MTASGPGGGCVSFAGSSAAIPAVLASPTPRSRLGCGGPDTPRCWTRSPSPAKPPGMRRAVYARLLARLAAAEGDLSLPLTLGGPRFAHRYDPPGPTGP